MRFCTRWRKGLELTVSLALALALPVVGCSPDNPDKRPVGTLEDLRLLHERDDINVLFVLIDTLRSDRLGVYGYDRETSPAIDYLAETGIRFAEHRSQSSWTKSSMASLWTGLYPVRTDVVRHRDAIAQDALMVAEVFKNVGFVTAGIWRNGWVAPNFGFAQGFELYLSPSSKQAPESMRQEARAGRIDGTDIDVMLSAIEFLRSHRTERWFLYLHMMDVHQYISTEETAIFGNSYSDAYDNSILWTDSQLGEVLMELYNLDLESRTIVVVASDHGEAFGEHGTEGHARDLHAEVTSTPFVLSLPFKLSPPAVVRSETENIDIWPTVLEMLGIGGLPDSDGTSRLPLLLGEQPAPLQDLGFAELDRNWGKLDDDESLIVAVRDGDLRLIHDASDPDLDKLFNVAIDRAEQDDLAEKLPEQITRLQKEAETYLSGETPWGGEAPEVEIDEMHLRQLRALGYSVE